MKLKESVLGPVKAAKNNLATSRENLSFFLPVRLNLRGGHQTE